MSPSRPPFERSCATETVAYIGTRYGKDSAPNPRQETMNRISPLDPPYDEEIGPILESMMPPGVDPLIHKSSHN